MTERGQGSTSNSSDDQVRQLDVPAIKALAHPLRLRLLSLLRAEGPATATELARRVGNTTSGTTSWHLRQLSAAGLVAEAPDGGGRERRWRAAQRGTAMRFGNLLDDPETSAAVGSLLHAMFTQRTGWELAWLDTVETADRVWVDAADFSDHLLRLPPAGLRELAAELSAVIERHRQVQNDDDEQALPVSVVVHAFPRVDLDPRAGGRWRQP